MAKANKPTSDQVLRQQLREFWAEVLTQLQIERDALVEIADRYELPIEDEFDDDGNLKKIPLPFRLPKEFIEKAAKASDQIRRDFPNKQPAANQSTESTTSSPPAKKASPKLGSLRAVS